jgi:hypothetical protein
VVITMAIPTLTYSSDTRSLTKIRDKRNNRNENVYECGGMPIKKSN